MAVERKRGKEGAPAVARVLEFAAFPIASPAFCASHRGSHQRKYSKWEIIIIFPLPSSKSSVANQECSANKVSQSNGSKGKAFGFWRADQRRELYLLATTITSALLAKQHFKSSVCVCCHQSQQFTTEGNHFGLWLLLLFLIISFKNRKQKVKKQTRNLQKQQLRSTLHSWARHFSALESEKCWWWK